MAGLDLFICAIAALGITPGVAAEQQQPERMMLPPPTVKRKSLVQRIAKRLGYVIG
jgi:hypothetical protein